MYELQRVGESSYYVQSPAKIGIVKINDGEVCLIDSGNDKDAGKKVLRILEENGWQLTAIYNTHCHADHDGGNKFLQTKTGCRIYASRMETYFINSPIMEPALLYGGFPPSELHHKFLLAQESHAECLTPECLPEGMTAIPLPGHFFEMVGFRTKDDVVYLADCLCSRETLNKYKISFLYDVEAYLRTLTEVEQMKAAMFVPAHAPATEDIAPLVRYNIENVNEIADKIVELCREPILFEKVLQRLFQEYELQMDFEQYALVGSTVRSYLSWLKGKGRLCANFEDGQLLWAEVR